MTIRIKEGTKKGRSGTVRTKGRRALDREDDDDDELDLDAVNDALGLEGDERLVWLSDYAPRTALAMGARGPRRGVCY